MQRIAIKYKNNYPRSFDKYFGSLLQPTTSVVGGMIDLILTVLTVSGIFISFKNMFNKKFETVKSVLFNFNN